MSDEQGWYYLRDGGSMGPVTSKRLLELLGEAIITRQTLVWREGAADWQPLETSLGLSFNHPPALPGAIAPGMPPIPKAPDATRTSLAAGTTYSDTEPHPWRRYFARMFDTTVGSSVMFFAIGIILVVVNQDTYKAFLDLLDKPDSRFINIFLNCALAMVPNALCIGLTGSSLGKWIFGVSITDANERPIGIKTAFQREVMVWFRGLGIGIPIISLFTLITAFKTLKQDRKTSWDRDLSLKAVYRPATTIQMVLNCFGVLLWLGITIALLALDNV